MPAVGMATPSSSHLVQTSLAEALEAGDDWADVDESAEKVRLATRRHAELWRSIRSSLKERDSWNAKLLQLRSAADKETSLEGQIQAGRLRGAAANAKSKELLAKGRAYTATYRRMQKLDAHLLALLQEVRELEKNPDVVIDRENRLDDAMREAVLEDDPSKMRSLLDSLPRRLASQEADQIINDRGTLAIRDLQSKIAGCKRAIAAKQLAERGVAMVAEADPPPSDVGPKARHSTAYEEDVQVQLVGLQSPEYNGRHGVILAGAVERQGRVTVKVNGKSVLIKLDNVMRVDSSLER
mmetsp:Transcript_56100/g.156301  ORF Transcript_56100/g.156301 Transcript_56100/m.156301 type:complete len:297 (-) Transcript_56100:159-1049(-)